MALVECRFSKLVSLYNNRISLFDVEVARKAISAS